VTQQVKSVDTSKPAAVREVRVEVPEVIQQAISDSLERGKRDAQQQDVTRAEKGSGFKSR
jgi:hypothetical protein